MVTLKYSALRSDVFRVAMVKLASCQMDAETSAKFLDLAKELENCLRASQVEWVDLLKPNCEIEEDKFKLNADNSDFAWLAGVEPGLMRAKIMEFANKDVILDKYEPVKVKLGDVKFSPVELSALDPIVSIQIEP